MDDPLSAQALLSHVKALATDIGPRPAGHPAEAEARAYVRRALAAAGITDVTGSVFPAWDTWGYTLVSPVVAALAGNLLGGAGRGSKLLGGLASLLGAAQVVAGAGVRRQPMAPFLARRQSGNVVARIPSAGARRQRAVLVGHLDTNKARATFTPALRRWSVPLVTMGTGLLAANGAAQLAQALGGGEPARRLRQASFWGLVASLGLLIYDELGDYVAGANDNASAVACLLGLAAHLQRQPLANTEVWLAFTGAEEVGGLGTHALLDAHGQALADAWFIDLEMVGSEQVVYVTRHSSGSYLTAYTPDDESLALAAETARRHPEMGVRGQPLTILEEVGALRARGFRGVCLAAVGRDGWLANWHQASDDVAHVAVGGLVRAARFALAMLQVLDEENL